MRLKEIWRRTLFYLSVPKCVGCGEKLDISDRALCPSCLSDHRFLKLGDCSLCAKTLDKCSCSNKYLREHRVKRVVKVFRYLFTDEVSPSNNLIYSLKRDNRTDVLELLADELTASILNSVPDASDWTFVNVPRRSAAIKKYGIDHAALLAKAVSKRLGAEYISPLRSKAQKQQKHTRGEQRIKNAAIIVKRGKHDLKGRKIILVDDIVTTGASLAASAAELYKLGAKTVIGAAIAIAYKDEYTPFPNPAYNK